jgi:hypothetical protein
LGIAPSSISGLLADKRNRIVAAISSPLSINFVLARFLEDGRLDQLYGIDEDELFSLGQRKPEGRSAAVQDIALTVDDRIIAGGTTSQDCAQQLALVRYLPNGGLDPSFGDQGWVQKSFLE